MRHPLRFDPTSISAWAQEASQWLDDDYALITSQEGWTPLTPEPNPCEWRRRMPYNPSHMFRWRLDLPAPPEVVFRVLVDQIAEYHRHFTKELIDAAVANELGPEAKIIYQRFRSVFPGVSPRDLCHLNVSRKLDGGALLASHRSVGFVPPQRGFARLRWWGCTLCLPLDDGRKTNLWYIDQEDVGGWIPVWVSNRTMVNYTRIHRQNIRHFFSNGGPEEAYRAVGRSRVVSESEAPLGGQNIPPLL